MTEITKDTTIISSNKNSKNGIKLISLMKIPQKFTKANNSNKPNKSLLGKKRRTFKKISQKIKNKKAQLSINKQEQFSLKKINNIKNQEPCIICFEKISFQDKHYLHCGHNFHCQCINRWLDMGNYECPICKRDIDCDKVSDYSISLEEDDDNDNALNINELNRNNNINNFENGIIINHSNNRDIKIIFGFYVFVIIIYLLRLFLNITGSD